MTGAEKPETPPSPPARARRAARAVRVGHAGSTGGRAGRAGRRVGSTGGRAACRTVGARWRAICRGAVASRCSRPDELPGPFRRSFWRSPIRGPWLTSVFGLVLLAGITVMFVTGLLSYAAYNPDLSPDQRHDPGQGVARLLPVLLAHPSGVALPVNQGVHVTLGLVLVPILLAKLWSVLPKLFEWPPVRNPGARAGTAVPVPARRRGACSSSPPGSSTSSSGTCSRLVLHPALLRRLGLRGRLRGTRGPEGPHGGQGAAQRAG